VRRKNVEIKQKKCKKKKISRRVVRVQPQASEKYWKGRTPIKSETAKKRVWEKGDGAEGSHSGLKKGERVSHGATEHQIRSGLRGISSGTQVDA